MGGETNSFCSPVFQGLHTWLLCMFYLPSLECSMPRCLRSLMTFSSNHFRVRTRPGWCSDQYEEQTTMKASLSNISLAKLPLLLRPSAVGYCSLVQLQAERCGVACQPCICEGNLRKEPWGRDIRADSEGDQQAGVNCIGPSPPDAWVKVPQLPRWELKQFHPKHDVWLRIHCNVENLTLPSPSQDQCQKLKCMS